MIRVVADNGTLVMSCLRSNQAMCEYDADQGKSTLGSDVGCTVAWFAYGSAQAGNFITDHA